LHSELTHTDPARRIADPRTANQHAKTPLVMHDCGYALTSSELSAEQNVAGQSRLPTVRLRYYQGAAQGVSTNIRATSALPLKDQIAEMP
jgi:hypothetical protein